MADAAGRAKLSKDPDLVAGSGISDWQSDPETHLGQGIKEGSLADGGGIGCSSFHPDPICCCRIWICFHDWSDPDIRWRKSRIPG